MMQQRCRDRLLGESREDQHPFDNDVHVRENATGWNQSKDTTTSPQRFVVASCRFRCSCRMFKSRTLPGNGTGTGAVTDDRLRG